MNELSLADLIALQTYLQNHNNGKTVSMWGALIVAVDYEIEIRVNKLYNKL